ncbi:hypothetical protein [Modestobacter sp. SSW1-42]|uniref:hypothetical protein n=1 Tax=Modestobacter sp. SSW1-42 TaxID=596372 RepID=UPI0039881E94
MTAEQEPTLAQVWAATVADARRQLAAVERGKMRASGRQLRTWRRIIANAEQWGLA